MDEARVMEYMNQGGRLFIITSIDTMRDGGTKEIRTTNGVYTISRDGNTFKKGREQFTDELSKEYLLEAIDKYIVRQEFDVNMLKAFVNEKLKKGSV